MIHVLNVRVEPATGRMECEVAQNMTEEQVAEVLAASALAWAKTSSGTPRTVLERALRVLLDNPEAIGERANIILPGSVS